MTMVTSTAHSRAGSTASRPRGTRDDLGKGLPRFHADDLGMNQSVNVATAALLETGEVTSVSIMANQPCTTEAAEIVRRHPEATVYLHFNLTGGHPLSGPEGLGGRPASRNDGPIVRGLPRLLAGLLWGTVHPDVVEAELNAQLDRLLDLGVTVSGIDSHHHVHAFAPIGQVVERVATQRSILHVRRYHMMRTYTVWGGAKMALFKVGARATAWRSVGSTSLGPAWSGGDGPGCGGAGDNQPFAVASWERLGPRAVQESGTIVCHPGNTCDARTSLPFVALNA